MLRSKESMVGRTLSGVKSETSMALSSGSSIMLRLYESWANPERTAKNVFSEFVAIEDAARSAFIVSAAKVITAIALLAPRSTLSPETATNVASKTHSPMTVVEEELVTSAVKVVVTTLEAAVVAQATVTPHSWRSVLSYKVLWVLTKTASNHP